MIPTGNGSSASVSLSELPRTSGSNTSRPRLSQRENSKDSTLDGPAAPSAGRCYADDEPGELRPRAVTASAIAIHPIVEQKYANF